MTYPDDFPPVAQDSVEREKVLASQAFEQCTEAVFGDWGGELEIAECIRTYVMRVVSAFGIQACELGRKGLWSAAKIDAAVHEFITQVAFEAEREKGFDQSGRHLKTFRFRSPGLSKISDSELYLLKKQADWKKYQDALVVVTERSFRVAERSMAPPPVLSPDLSGITGIFPEVGSIRNPFLRVPHQDTEEKLKAEAKELHDRIGGKAFFDLCGISKQSYYNLLDGAAKDGVKAKVRDGLSKSKKV